MDVPPREPDERVLTRGGWFAIGGYGLLIAAVVLGVFYLALGPLGLGQAEAVTISFLTLSISRLTHVFNMRNPHSGVLRNEISANPWVWGAFALSIGLLLVAVYAPVFADVLSVTPPGLSGWTLIAAGGFVTWLIGQLFLIWQRVRSDGDGNSDTTASA
jgi:Ca2+-transporting ATPase